MSKAKKKNEEVFSEIDTIGMNPLNFHNDVTFFEFLKRKMEKNTSKLRENQCIIPPTCQVTLNLEKFPTGKVRKDGGKKGRREEGKWFPISQLNMSQETGIEK